MFKLNLKIALRNLWKNRGITMINVGGLSIALAAFILVAIYVTFETTYDGDNKNYDNIYQVGRDLPDFKTYYTSPPLARAIRENFPEVELVGKTKGLSFEFPLNTPDARVYSNNSLQMDYDAALIFNIQPEGGLKKPVGQFGEMYLPVEIKKQLFPKSPLNSQEMVVVGPSTAGQMQSIKGIIQHDNSHSNINFDLLAVWNEVGANEDYGYNNYNTYIQVRPGTDVNNLQQKIDALYKKAMIAHGWAADDARIKNRSVIFLDPLKNLHLKPRAGTDANYKIVMVLSVLALLILVIACINFTNLSISQANKRAKEVGVKKVMGAYRSTLILQFITEIFMQCALAIVLGLIIAEAAMPLFNAMIGGHLSIFESGGALVWQLPLILVIITLISGLYPSVILSGYRPAYVLKGNLQTSYKTYWLRNSLLITQFGIAVVFITSLLIVQRQVKYMQTEDPGFNPQQVVSIKNISFFNDPKKFEPIRQELKTIPGVRTATVATTIPDGSSTGTNGYAMNGKEERLSFIDVDFEYFETLGIKAKEGRLFSPDFIADTATSAILNESAAKKFGVEHTVGSIITGCGIPYKVVGVIPDFKMEGFEKAVEPTIYAIKNPCGNLKLQIMVSIDKNQMSAALAAIKARWSVINKQDGEDFRYNFLDELYGRLFEKQEQLRSVFFAASVLTIFIAIMGLFAFAAYSISNKVKEISIRKILGATDFQLLTLLNSNFVRLVILANVIASPLAWFVANRWLNSFAYRIDIPAWPFIIAAAMSIGLTMLTVSLQALKTVKANPVDALKYE